ncbi:tyrosine-type recombinase/integrase [Sinomicrobium kalidii]|uniref:tyrosine-type recombinase/integrase n=1 Tax=Sinomicrobium kalidii TaxID=2900738 RepID=UPI001E62CB51|nr:tyrosine-type recombinase/integrase [Sinomicrobium kalidii]UGU14432.1 tyrosine-type recombinase/integrase [Sinomicrobium kalidii]
MYFYLNNPSSEKDQLILLMYWVSYDKQKFKYSTGQFISPKDWDSESKMPVIKRGRSDLSAIKSVLDRYSGFLNKLLDNAKINDEIITLNFLRTEFDKKFKPKKTRITTSKRLPDLIQDFIDRKNKSEGKSEHWNKKFKALKGKIRYYEEDRSKNLRFDDINEDFIDDWSGFLRKIDKEPYKPHNDNTLKREIDFLFTFLYWAKGKYHDIDFKELKNPIKKYEPDDVYLTKDEIEKIEELELTEEDLIQVRDLFLIGVYSGQRFSDYSVFEKEDVKGNMIIKVAEKTEHDSFIPLLPKLKALLEKYDWNIPVIHEKTFNRKLRKICKMAEIDESIKETVYRGNKKEVIYWKKYETVGSHTARRTFITLSSERGMPDHIIMKVTGIKNPQTLIKYKKTSQRSIKEQMEKYWG